GLADAAERAESSSGRDRTGERAPAVQRHRSRHQRMIEAEPLREPRANHEATLSRSWDRAPLPVVRIGSTLAGMARIDIPDRGMGEHIDWALARAKMAVGMGALSDAVYGNTQLSLREREAARWTIALINDCAVCQDTRAAKGAEAGID